MFIQVGQEWHCRDGSATKIVEQREGETRCWACDNGQCVDHYGNASERPSDKDLMSQLTAERGWTDDPVADKFMDESGGF